MAMCVRALVLIFSFAAFFGWMTMILRADPLAAVDATSHVGQIATVCGVVASASIPRNLFGAPRLPDFDSAYPKALFTADFQRRAPNSERPRRRSAARDLRTGEIRLYAGTPQVSPSPTN